MTILEYVLDCQSTQSHQTNTEGLFNILSTASTITQGESIPSQLTRNIFNFHKLLQEKSHSPFHPTKQFFHLSFLFDHQNQLQQAETRKTWRKQSSIMKNYFCQFFPSSSSTAAEKKYGAQREKLKTKMGK